MLIDKEFSVKDAMIVAAIEEAFDSAGAATKGFLALHGDRDACGFAWVTVKPGNSKVAKILVSKFGARSGGRGGVTVWNPSNSYTQAITAKEEGAWAFAERLRFHFGDSIRVEVDSRMD